jgi:cyclopropane fatty-acyl-phospholipid synthase-like methyltransferase
MYDRHPISAEQILARLTKARGSLDSLQAADLFDHDQDHYGGLAANDEIARCAKLRTGMNVVDFCAGLGGPARYLAHAYGVHVTGIDLNANRVEGARDLTLRVGLSDRVTMIEGDVTAVPLADASADVVVSQEALLHVPDKGRALAEASRLLVTGGRLVFTDWVMHGAIAAADADLLWRGLAAQSLQSISGYGDLIAVAGLQLEMCDDLTVTWGDILQTRFAMYKALADERRAAGMAPGEDEFYNAYSALVRLVETGYLGGCRFCAVK